MTLKVYSIIKLKVIVYFPETNKVNEQILIIIFNLLNILIKYNILSLY